MKNTICSILGISPLILLFVNNQFPSFCDKNKLFIISAFAIAMCMVMLFWEEEKSVGAWSAIIVLLIGAERIYNFSQANTSFSKLFESLCFIVCSIGYFKYMILSKKTNK